MRTLYVYLLLPVMAIANANVRSAHQISSLVGWAATPHRIFWTTNAGVEWSDITPSVSSSNISSVFFADEAHGWIVAFSGLSWSLAQTGNAGRTWQIRPLPAPTDATDYSGVSSVFFSDLNHGEIYLRLASSSNFIISLQLTSADGGATWNVVPGPKIQNGNSTTHQDLTQGWFVNANGFCAGFKFARVAALPDG